MSDITYDELLNLFVEAGFPPPMAKQMILAIQGQSEEARNQLFEDIRKDPGALRVAIARAAKETINDVAKHLFPARIIARHEDGTFDLELDLTAKIFHQLRSNFEASAELLGLELKEGVRFYNVPGEEEHPIGATLDRAMIGFYRMDLAKPYATPPLVLLSGEPDEARAFATPSKIDVN